MGCVVCKEIRGDGCRKQPKSIGEAAVFVRGFRIPKPIQFPESLSNHVSKHLVEHLSALRTRIAVLAGQERVTITKRRKSIAQYGGSTLSDLHHALEDYLPILLGIIEDGRHPQLEVRFLWENQEDNEDETGMENPWYEVLSVLHLMAMITLTRANLLLVSSISADAHHVKVLDENRRASVDVFLKAAGYLDFAVKNVLPQLPESSRDELPVDLQESNLRAFTLQALGQCVDVQLGMAIKSVKATLAVKRRLACEMVKCWNQAQDNIEKLPLSNGWGEKHLNFVKWKSSEAKAAAYYFHGVILGEGNEEKSQAMAMAALLAAEEFFHESRRECDIFHATPPLSKNPPLWGARKYIFEKLAKDDSTTNLTNRNVHCSTKTMEKAPTLPDFALALKPEDYHLPPLDPRWSEVNKPPW